jgi:transposase
MLTVGLDVHFDKTSMCVLDDNGKKIRQRQIKGPWPAVVKELSELQEPFQVCYEASLGYGVLYDQIARLPNASKTLVAHPGELRLIYRNKKKNDRVDGEKIAKLMFLDQVPAVHVPSPEVRSWRGLIEWRQKLVGRRAMVKNQIRSLLKGLGIVPLKGNRLWTGKGIQWLKEQAFAMGVNALRRDMLVEELQEHEGRILRVEKELDGIAVKHPGVVLLQSVPGVGPRTAEAFMAYIDDPRRFRQVRQVGVYLGLVPCQDASGTTNRLGHITKDGPATVRKLLTETVWQGIARKDERIKAHFEQICKGDKDRKKIAVVATARWLSTVMLAMLKSGECWRAVETAPRTDAYQKSPASQEAKK